MCTGHAANPGCDPRRHGSPGEHDILLASQWEIIDTFKQDSIVEQMTLEQYNAALRPKVHGSWNLHKLLSKNDLEFFVMLSSLSGVVGLASQCNYAAGGTF